MTLIVFQKKDDVVTVCSDMKMIWDSSNPIPKQIYGWRPKVIIINDDIAIAWAGELFFAEKALIDIWNIWRTLSEDKVLNILVDYHKRSLQNNTETEFILVSRRNKSYKISERNCYDITEVPLDYIGDEELYSFFIKSKHKNNTYVHGENASLSILRIGDEGDNSREMLGKTVAKMQNISEIYADTNLGHVIVPCSACSHKPFEYHMNLNIDTPANFKNTNGKWETVELGNLKIGGYAYQTKCHKEHGHTILVYENLYNRKHYYFSDFRKGVPIVSTNNQLVAPQ